MKTPVRNEDRDRAYGKPPLANRDASSNRD
jgi:hypothetical protein